jgi:glycosyltransferase involved in cell wall biosynthesis
MDYSIIIATYNSQNHIRFLVEEIVKIFKDKKASFEIVLVNDASLDNTQQVLENLSLSHQEIRIFELTRNSGQQIAFSAGIDHATGDLIVLLDDDMVNVEIPLNEIIGPVSRKEFDIAIGTSSPRGFARRVTSRVFWKLMGKISSQVIKNRELTLRCFSREVASQYKLYKERLRSITEIMLDLGYRRTYVEVNSLEFRGIKSRHNFHKRFKLFIQIISTSRQNSGFGLMYFGIFSFTMFPFSVITFYILGMISLENRTALIIAGMIWLSFSSFVFIFGLVLFVISMLLRETQQRPLYHVKISSTPQENL